MFNVTGGELFMILVVALIVLGPERLPGAARRIGEVVGQLRDISDSFKREVAQAMDDPGEPIVKPMSRPHLTALDGGAAAPEPAAEPSPTGADPAGADQSAGGTRTVDGTVADPPPPPTTTPVPPVPEHLAAAAGSAGESPSAPTHAAPLVDDAAGVVPPQPSAGGPAPGPDWTPT